MIVMRDVIRLAETVSDGYGDSTVNYLADVDALFLQSTGTTHTGSRDAIESDAHVYLDINHSTLVERGFRIEGMYLIANPLGSATDQSWYKIIRVVVGQRKLLTNEVDNVHAFLQKVAKPLQNVVS